MLRPKTPHNRRKVDSHADLAVCRPEEDNVTGDMDTRVQARGEVLLLVVRGQEEAPGGVGYGGCGRKQRCPPRWP